MLIICIRPSAFLFACKSHCFNNFFLSFSELLREKLVDICKVLSDSGKVTPSHKKLIQTFLKRNEKEILSLCQEKFQVSYYFFNNDILYIYLFIGCHS